MMFYTHIHFLNKVKIIKLVISLTSPISFIQNEIDKILNNPII